MRRPALLAAGLGIWLAGCATAPTGPARVTRPLPPDDARAQQLVDDMHAAAERRRALRGMASFSFDGSAGSVRSRQAIVLEQPSHLRIEVLGFLSQAVAVLVTDGQQFELFRAKGRVHRSGAVYPGLLFEVAQIDLTPAEGVALLLGAPPDVPGLRVAGAMGLEEGGVRVDLKDGRRVLRQRLEFDADGRLRRVESWAPGDRLVWSASYAHYQQLSGVEFAHAIELWFPESETRVELDFGSVQLNPELPPEVFHLDLPRARAPGGGGAA